MSKLTQTNKTAFLQIFVAKLLPIMMNSIIKAFVYLLVTGVVVTIRWIHDPVSSNYKKKFFFNFYRLRVKNIFILIIDEN